MTKPKRRVGNPLGDSKQPKFERLLWLEANYYAEHLIDSTTKILKYTQGLYHSPGIHDLKVQSDRLHDALLLAIHLRKARLERNKND